MLLKLLLICVLLLSITWVTYIIITFHTLKKDVFKVEKEHKLVKCSKCLTYVQEQDTNKKGTLFLCKEHRTGGGGN